MGEGVTSAQRYDYDAFGNAIGFEPSQALTQFLYCGEQFDSKLGWTYLRARYYDPKVGRFNRLDSFFGNTSDPQSLHKYTYCHGDPVNHVDPSGMFLGVAFTGIGVLTAFAIGNHLYANKSRVDVATGATIASKIQTMSKVYNFLIASHLTMSGIPMAYYLFGSGGVRSDTGLGGLDVTRQLLSLQSAVKKDWDKLSKENKKKMMCNLYSFNPMSDSMIIRGWDIDEFYKYKKGKFAGPKESGFCPNTVTVSKKVYFAEEVNYFLWGLVI